MVVYLEVTALFRLFFSDEQIFCDDLFESIFRQRARLHFGLTLHGYEQKGWDTGNVENTCQLGWATSLKFLLPLGAAKSIAERGPNSTATGKIKQLAALRSYTNTGPNRSSGRNAR